MNRNCALPRLVDACFCIGRIAVFVFIGFFASPVALADSRPALFFYPLPYHYSDGHILDSPQTITVEQSTEDVEFVPEMSGVVIIVYWSTLCPTEQCDFSLIDKIIDYWSSRGKKIVLSVATIGFPIMAVPSRQGVEGATPDWVMKKIRTYEFRSRVLGSGSQDASGSYTFPDFRDPAFLRLNLLLVHELAKRYDGNPSISQIRISTGLMGEENPIVGPLSMPMAGYQEGQWIDYCEAMVKEYEDAFRKSELEFDISRLWWVRAIGNPRDKASVDAFVSDLARQKVFIAWNGLQSEADDWLGSGSDSKDGRAQAIRFLQAYKRQGGRVGLEAIGPLTNPKMGTVDLANVEKLSHVISVIAPDRLVLFSDAARAIHEKSDPEHHAAELLKRIGFEARAN